MTSKEEINSNQVVELKKAIFDLASALGIERVELHFAKNENTPSTTAILHTIRVIAPCQKEELLERLSENGFSIPSLLWIGRTLDKLRKKGAIVRRSDGRYLLSFATIVALGTERNDQSPDVKRTLDVGRRGGYH